MDETTVSVGERTVRRLGFGSMRLTGPRAFGEPADPRNSIAVLRRAVDLGVELIDTAPYYGPDVADRLIAEALRPYPDHVLIATKAGAVRDETGRWLADPRPDRMRASCEDSLRNLRVDHIDLLQVRYGMSDQPMEPDLETVAALQAEGKVRHVGVSNVDVDQLEAARAIVPVVAVQNSFNLGERHWEPVLEACQRAGIAFIAYFPIGRGGLAGHDGPVGRVAARHGATPAQVALAWVLARSPVSLPIPGTSSVAHLEENMGAAGLALTPDDLAELDRVPPAGGANAQGGRPNAR